MKVYKITIEEETEGLKAEFYQSDSNLIEMLNGHYFNNSIKLLENSQVNTIKQIILEQLNIKLKIW